MIIRPPQPQINAKKGVNCHSPKKIQAKNIILYIPRQIQNIWYYNNNNIEQAEAELCQAQVKLSSLRLVR